MKVKRAARPVGMAWLAAALLPLGAPQTAAQPGTDAADMLVTGTRAARSPASPLPVTVISREELAASGDVSVAEFLNRQDVNSFGSLVPESGLQGGQQGQALLNLRGLGPQRTLVLVDGRRIANTPAFHGSEQNLNALPLALIERIEVLREGGSALYGSDAIGGVVNIITRRDFDGVELAGQIERPTGSGAGAHQVSLLAGQSSARGNITVVVEHFEREALMRRDRPYLHAQEPSPIGGPGSFFRVADRSAPTSGLIPSPNIDGAIIEPFASCPSEFDGDAHPASAREVFPVFSWDDVVCLYRFSDDAGQSAALQRDSVALSGDLNLGDNVTAFTRMRATRARSFGRFAAAPVSPLLGGLTMAADNPNNPTAGEDDGPHDIVLLFRPVAAGTRDNTGRDQVNELLVGLQGESGAGALHADWEAVLYHNRYTQSEIGMNYGLRPMLQEAVDSGAFNPFDPDPDGIARFSHSISSDNSFRARGGEARARFDDLLRAGPLSVPLVAGGEYREERYATTFDQQSEAGNVFGSAGGGAAGRRHYSALYAESVLPLSAERLELGLALRWDNYSDFGSTLSPRSSLGWRPAEALLLRASYGEGFRAPDLKTLNRQSVQSFSSAVDRLGCELDPDNTFACEGRQHETLTTGNPDLDAEMSRHYNFGVELAPLRDLTIAIDYFHIRLRDGIDSLSAQDVLENELRCHQEGRACNPAQEGTVIRTAAAEEGGQVQRIIAPAANFARTRSEGFDLRGDYARDTAIGRFGLDVSGIYTRRHERSTAPHAPLEETTRSVGRPQWRGTARASLSQGSWQGSLLVHHIPSTRDCSISKLNSDAPAAIEDCARRVGSFTTLDAQARWNTPWNGELSFGVRNLLDRNPPLSEEIGVPGYPEPDPGLYNLLGRIPYARYVHRF